MGTQHDTGVVGQSQPSHRQWLPHRPWLSPGRVQSLRAVVTQSARVLGAAFVLYGIYLVLARVVYAILMDQGDFLMSLQTHMQVGADHGIIRGLPMIAVGVTLALMSRRLARWAVVVPESGCPRCRYAGTAEGGICPECGLWGVEPAADTSSA